MERWWLQGTHPSVVLHALRPWRDHSLLPPHTLSFNRGCPPLPFGILEGGGSLSPPVTQANTSSPGTCPSQSSHLLPRIPFHPDQWRGWSGPGLSSLPDGTVCSLFLSGLSSPPSTSFQLGMHPPHPFFSPFFPSWAPGYFSHFNLLRPWNESPVTGIWNSRNQM